MNFLSIESKASFSTISFFIMVSPCYDEERRVGSNVKALDSQSKALQEHPRCCGFDSHTLRHTQKKKFHPF